MVDEEAEPRRAAALMERLAMAHWRAGRPRDGLDTAERALALVETASRPPSGRRSRVVGKTRMLQGRYREATEAARKAIEAAEATGDQAALAGALNGMGTSLWPRARSRRARPSCAGRWRSRASRTARARSRARQVNLADALHIAGRTARRSPSPAPGARTPRAGQPRRLARRDDRRDAVEARRLGRGRAAPARRGPPLPGQRARVRRADPRRAGLGRGRHDEAARTSRGSRSRSARVAEPQWHGAYGALLAELRRRQGDLDGARAAVDDALDRIEFCTEDAARLARVSAAGVTVEADRAQRGARPRRRRGGRPRARRIEGSSCASRRRARPAARSRRRGCATARAEPPAPRATPRWSCGARPPPRGTAVGRPYPAARARCARPRRTPGAATRDAAAAAAAAALATARAARRRVAGAARWRASSRGPGWRAARRRRRAAGPAARAPSGGEDPFGLTPRERQVLALVAEGATNREIGAQLFMAEKTASVHVSRILAKLDVRSRTEAAGGRAPAQGSRTDRGLDVLLVERGAGRGLL